MTACNLIQIPGRDAIFLFSDTAMYDASGVTVGFGTKLLPVPSARAAVATSGSTAIKDQLFLLINSTVPRSVEALKDDVRHYVELLIRDFDGVSASTHFSVFVAGFSEDRTRRVYEIEGNMVDGTVNVEDIDDTCCRFRPAVTNDFAIKDDPLELGLEIMEAQRSNRYPVWGKQACIVGGSALAAVVTFDDVALLALKHWQGEIEAGCAVDGIAAGSSSNYTVDTSGKRVLPSSGFTRVTGGTPTAPLGGTAGNINDNNTGTSISPAPGNLSAAAINSRILAKIDYGSNQTITRIEAVGLSQSAGGNSGTGLYYSTDGTTWTQLGANLPMTSTTPATTTRDGSVTARYVAIILPATDFSTVNVTLQDLNGYVSTPSNMTVVTTAQSTFGDATVSNGRVLIEYDNTATPTLNTDLTVEVTCNGGTNWSAATLSLVSSNGQGGRSIAETADTACTSGVSFAARIKTFNNKSIPIHGVSLTVH
ncbi:discoidin domain-containing protein [Bradyrhizobium sp. 1(2017)]|uniref:discoidin domain-containing protein n=1 Tax=Bradyrhizobium sp. 1(2017) TaxID=1404888 RepID=UPI00140F291C|nr:discoidin domain-containing protein [Bradyrhizobium sp. 1(2017)]QIO34646.1 discoidin domain-containing protein [Bradyrhizobium sp. 1(2017)]